MSRGATGSPDFTTTDAVIPDAIPSYTPLNRYILREFESTTQVPLRDDGIKDAVRSQLNGGLQDLFAYVECFYENDLKKVDTELTDTYLEMAIQALKAQFDLDMMSNAIAKAREQLKSDINENPELMLETLEYFESVDKQGVFKTVKQRYLEAMATKDTDFVEYLESNPYYEMYRNAAQIIMDPYLVIANEDNDDDVGISGGKISLTDPISMTKLEDPQRLRKCGHTFNLDYIKKNVGSRGIDCPIPGCLYQLTKDDFVPDISMRLRIKVANEKEKQGKRKPVDSVRTRELTPA